MASRSAGTRQVGPTLVADAANTLLAVDVAYFDWVRDGAPGPNNGLYLVPAP